MLLSRCGDGHASRTAASVRTAAQTAHARTISPASAGRSPPYTRRAGVSAGSSSARAFSAGSSSGNAFTAGCLRARIARRYSAKCHPSSTSITAAKIYPAAPESSCIAPPPFVIPLLIIHRFSRLGKRQFPVCRPYFEYNAHSAFFCPFLLFYLLCFIPCVIVNKKQNKRTSSAKEG